MPTPDAGEPARAAVTRRGEQPPEGSDWRARLHAVVFESDTPAGRAFDVVLIVLVVLSIVVVSLETVPGLAGGTLQALQAVEWGLTGLFTVEYGLRLVAVRRPAAYAVSFFGIVDLLAILPGYLSLLFPGAQAMLVLRVVRLLRVFRVFKLGHFVREASVLARALMASTRKITVFLLVLVTVVVVAAAVMYLVEGPEHGFTSIPLAMYWAVVTLTTVGYGDISPGTPLGRTIASGLMILGYAILAVPTGIVTAELATVWRGGAESTQHCRGCGAVGHQVDAAYCRRCGEPL